jgi:diguanylate cyclase (GGDEF)-like protein/PAS domain S-box-containing protein
MGRRGPRNTTKDLPAQEDAHASPNGAGVHPDPEPDGRLGGTAPREPGAHRADGRAPRRPVDPPPPPPPPPPRAAAALPTAPGRPDAAFGVPAVVLDPTELPALVHHGASIDPDIDGVVVQDLGGRVVGLDRRAGELLGDDPVGTLQRTSSRAVIKPDGTVLLPSELPASRALQRGVGVDDHFGIVEPSGAVRWFRASARPLRRVPSEAPYGVATSFHEVALHDSIPPGSIPVGPTVGAAAEPAPTSGPASAPAAAPDVDADADDAGWARARMLDAVGQAVLALDIEGRATYLNRAAEQLYGWSSAEAVGRHVSDVAPSSLTERELGEVIAHIRAGESWTGDVVVRPRHGRTFPALVNATPLYEDGRLQGIVSVAVDITDRKAAEEAFSHQALHDALTELPNRRSLIESLERLLADRVVEPGPQSPVGVFLVDVDDFKVVNDAFGHAAGDQLLRRCAQVLRVTAHLDDLVARFSGDSFAICCTHVSSPDDARAYSDQLRAALAQPIMVGGTEVGVRASAGVAISDLGATTAEDLLRRADTAMVRAKDDGKNVSRLYDEAMRERLLRQIEVEALVRRTVSSGRIDMAYQPITRLADQVVIGAEALLRLTDRAGVPVSAIEVVEAAERTGLINELGLLALRTSCQEAARWQQLVPERVLSVSVNLAATQLADPGLPDKVTAALQEANLEPSRLSLEITEGVLMSDSVRSARQLSQLKMRGVRISADDFGTGYSSLAYLKRFPLDAIKADLSFVAGLPDSPEDVAIVAAMMGVAEALGLIVIAEGVENERQRAELQRLGCGFGQGYLWSRAVDGDDFLALVNRDLEDGTEIDLDAEPDDAVVARPSAAAAGARAAERSDDVEGLDTVFRTLVHEIRTPLTVVMGYASLIETVEDAEMAGAATSIRRASERINQLISNLDDVRTVDQGTLVLELKAVDPRSVVERIVEQMGSMVGVPITIEADDHPPVELALDRNRIEQVITNLITNAAKYTPAGRPVVVRTGRADDCFEVSILDDGPGIPPEQLGLVYRKYGRADRTRPGSGIGLYLCRGIARAHGGDVLYRRRYEDHGSIFVLRLPLALPGR